MTDFPLMARDRTVSAPPTLIPLDFIHPGLSLAQIFSMVWAHRKLSLVIAVIALSLTVLVMAFWPRTYTATVALMVNYEVNDPLNGKELPIGQVGSYIATQVELMQTPEVLLAVVKRLGLTQHPEYVRGYQAASGTLPEWVATKIAKGLAIYQSQRGSQLIYVTYSAASAREAAQVANGVADVYKEQDHIRSTGPPGERAQRFAQQLAELKAKVDQAQTEVTAFYQRNGLTDDAGKTNVDSALQATLDERLIEAQHLRRTAEARAAQDQSVSDQVLSSNPTQALKAQLAAQELRLAQLNRAYSDQYPGVLDAKLQVEASRNSLAMALKTYSDNAAAGLGMAQRLEQGLQRAAADQRAKIMAKSQLQDDAAKYRLELESAQGVYKRALEAYDRIMFASGGHYTNVTLVSRATAPVSASKPKVLTGLIMGAIAALILALGLPLIIDLFNRRVRCRDDLERDHGVPVLVEFGMLPKRRPT
jgi:uncharacterized protein involved in exopolysaccharide biosynthesis